MSHTLDHHNLWKDALGEIEKGISKANFSTWFKETFVVKFEDGIIHLGVPNALVRDWLVNRFHKMILKTLRDRSEHVRSVEYTVSRNNIQKQAKMNDQNTFQAGAGELPLVEFYIDKDDNLNPRYTFDSFVVGPFNELAHAAAQAIIKQPGLVYNPLFIYGNTGHGKTHLIQAIGNHIKHSQKEKRVYYLTSEQWASEYMSSLSIGKIAQFKEKYRKYDILIMDDVQFFSKTEKTQDELFHLFNSLYDNNKQIVFSSDKHPNYIPNLEERLKSRWSQGMIVDIPTPDHESRMAILKAKIFKAGVNIAEEIIHFLADNVDGNIRELEGIVNAVNCQTQLKGRPLNFNEVRDIIKNNTKPKKMLSIQELIKIIANYYNIEEASLTDKTRRKEVVRPRQLAMYILREDFNASYPTIGEKFGGRDHTTVIHSCEKIKNDLKVDNTLAQQLVQIRTMF